MNYITDFSEQTLVVQRVWKKKKVQAVKWEHLGVTCVNQLSRGVSSDSVSI